MPLHPRSQGFVFAGTLAQGTLLCTAGRIESSHSMSALWKRRQSGNPQLDAFPRHRLLSFSPLFGFLVTPLLPFSPTTLQRHIVGFGTLPHTMAHKKHMHIKKLTQTHKLCQTHGHAWYSQSWGLLEVLDVCLMVQAYAAFFVCAKVLSLQQRRLGEIMFQLDVVQ